MSVQHTPPQNNLLQTGSTFATPMDYPSDASGTEIGHEAGLSAASGLSDPGFKVKKITKKCLRGSKRKQVDRDDISRTEFLEMFQLLKAEQDNKLDLIINSVNGVAASVSTLTTKLAEQDKTIKKLQENDAASQKEIYILKNQVESLQHKLCSTSLEIRNVPLAPKETKEDLKKIFINTAKYLKVPIQQSQIKDIYRRNTKSESKPIVADLTTVDAKENLLASFKKVTKELKQDKFCTTHLNIDGPIKPIYVSEYLTPHERKLFFQARDFAKRNEYAFCWTSYGRVFLRKQEGSPQVKISNEEDLAKLNSK